MNLPRKVIIVGATALAMVAAAAVPAIAAEPEGTILHAGGATAIPDSYIVVFNKNTVSRDQVAATARTLASRQGRTVARTYTAALRGFEITATARQAARIAAHPAVEYVEQNHTVHIADTQPNPPSWGLDRIDQRNLPLDNSYTYPNTASNVHSYIIDTGIRFSHSDFGGRAVSGFDAVDGGSADDCNGHGTHVAGTVGGTAYGVAKGTTLVGVRVLNCSGSGTTAGVIAGVDWVTANAVLPAVANMSLGGGANTSLDTAVRNSIAAGVTYSLAAGNSSANACNTSPARVTEAITVGSTTNTDARSSFSNFGTCLDVFAPGSSITSAWHTGDSATNTISGTSMAAPHVAGAAALVASVNPSWSPQQVRDYLYDNATVGAVGNPGSGSPNRLLYVVNDGTPPTNDFSVSVSPTSGSTAPGGSVSATVATSTTSGSAQSVALTASGLPSGATASFSPATVTSGGSSALTIATSAGTSPGTYPITITGTGTSATRTASFTLTVTGPGGGCTGTNGSDVAIPDTGAWVSSSIVISGCASTPSTSSTVDVNIQHTYRGDLIVDLIAPDGSSYRLKSWAFFDGADNVIETYTVNLSSETANGTWQLRVRDVFSGDTGYINTWTLDL
ncbi:S8 family serine peptidase [Solwaraspora sp. WMMD406]|uniref:S8 family peptidase n=1 Tax=Solwaraspora sp. WMMD406 TaxID=3016095 RepID=UPI002416F0B2|nr:S8 family serine peptidase [Solwaraspora sp. WMMD406]MDG4763536.1 S8 family serine peptidase [Solwaraspora sp. WMMD406]